MGAGRSLKASFKLAPWFFGGGVGGGSLVWFFTEKLDLKKGIMRPL